MDQLTNQLQQIRLAYPELIIDAARTLHGQFNDIVVVNEQLIFRFPRFAHVVEATKHEVVLLAKLQGRLPLPIPNPSYQSLSNAAVGQAFIGYRMITGEPLTRDVCLRLQDEVVLQGMASQLADFLRELHHLSLDELGLPAANADDFAYWDTLYQRIREKLFPDMRPDARQWTQHHFEPYLADASNFAYQPMLRHGDFGTANILYDPAALQICGVLDFSFAGVGDAASDFAAIMCPAGFGEPFLQRFYHVYPEIEVALPRARFYAGTFALMEALQGLADEDPKAFENGISAYR